MATYSERLLCFSIDHKDAYLHIVKHHCHFLLFNWQSKPYQLKVLTFWLTIDPKGFSVLT